MAYIPRLEENNQILGNMRTSPYYSDSYVGRWYYVMPNCCAYAYGRFHEIMGTKEDPAGCSLDGLGDAETWFQNVKGYVKGSTPKIGSVLCLGNGPYSGWGHVAIVEEIDSDGSIVTSESGYNAYYFKTKKRYPPYYNSEGYDFHGFIYNPNVSGNTSDPRTEFVKLASDHLGESGYAWVQAKTKVGNQPWGVALMCALAEEAKYAGFIMPKYTPSVEKFYQEMISVYHGNIIPGGEDVLPEVGDFAFISVKTESRGKTKTATSIHLVTSVEDGSISTIEATKYGSSKNEVKLYERTPKFFNFYIRPNWKVVEGVLNYQLVGGVLYTSKSTRADAALREVCYISNSTSKPLINRGNNKNLLRLSVINYTGVLASLVSSFGVQQTSGNDNIDGIYPPVAREIVSYLINHGLNTAGAIGIIANIQAESSFRIDAVEQGYPYEGRGICQWSFGRREQLIAKVPDWKTNLTGQLDFLWGELTTTYNSTVLQPIMSVPNTLEGAKQAADIFVRRFEIPGGVEEATLRRQANAEEFWKSVVVVNIVSPTVDAATDLRNSLNQISSSGERFNIPASVEQTGVIGDYTAYNYINWAYKQRTVYDKWVEKGKQHSNCVATLGGYYLIACATTFGTIGDMLKFVFTDGTSINCIMADAKSPNDSNITTWGHIKSGKVSVIEWEAHGFSGSSIVDNVMPQLVDGLKSMGTLGKTVVTVYNYGSYL